ncbi:MAG: DUF4405 domain-containing protein [Anaerolineaceae bacterium]|nr:DUF4405 domain-containing protein [Anaerolineaceae bacterium]
MKNKQVFYWFLDLIILVLLVVEYKMDWTGLQWHELLGIAMFGLMLLHLSTHWRWVVSVTGKVLQSISNKACFCYVVDFLLLFLFSSIILTGLIISTLLNLTLNHYDFWRFLHVSVSYLTVVVMGLKIALHWKWIVNTTKRKILRLSTAPVTAGCTTQCNSSDGINRRQFLEQTGIFSGAMIVSGVGYASWLSKVVFSGNEAQTVVGTIDTTIQDQQAIVVTETPFQPEQVQPTTASVVSEPDSAEIEQPLVMATQVPTAVPTAAPVVSNQSVRCPRGCSYPGHCRKYEDTNNNNRCDLSEW